MDTTDAIDAMDGIYRERRYRNEVRETGLATFEVQVRETDLWIRADRDMTALARESIIKYRNYLEEYIRIRPEFRDSLQPIGFDPVAPQIVRTMLEESAKAGVGPMAAVAGAVAQFVGEDILNGSSSQVIVENGGDIYLKSGREVRIGVFAGGSPLSGKIVLKISPEMSPLGICTSSATVGPSLSLGKADAVCVLARSAALADAAATAVGNRIRGRADIDPALRFGSKISGVTGILVIAGENMGACGELELV
ncbi:MAG TPA: UPF0280 family protein [Syntrophales bacterium]|nr:UPF0280 family protein [Syntrophales bacterium]